MGPHGGHPYGETALFIEPLRDNGRGCQRPSEGNAKG